jgi:hypothetical protein
MRLLMLILVILLEMWLVGLVVLLLRLPHDLTQRLIHAVEHRVVLAIAAR